MAWLNFRFGAPVLRRGTIIATALKSSRRFTYQGAKIERLCEHFDCPIAIARPLGFGPQARHDEIPVASV
jgi:hypothetical protein